MRFKSILIVLLFIIGVFCLSGCDETETEAALRRLKRAMNEVAAISSELDMLSESDFNYCELAIESGVAHDSTGSLPKLVELIDQMKIAHFDFYQTVAQINSMKSRIEYLINQIRNKEELSNQLNLERINRDIGILEEEAKTLKDTIGGVFRVYRTKVESNLNNVLAKAKELEETFESMKRSLESRVTSLERVANTLIDIEYDFSSLVYQQ
jgi:TolA-binding protein